MIKAMRVAVILICTLIFNIKIKAQNLVPNGDFETFSHCPVGYEDIYAAVPWESANTYISPSYFNACAPLASKVSVPLNTNNLIGYQLAHSGAGYAGVNLYQDNAPYPIDYLQIELSDSLKNGSLYCLNYYVSLWNYSKYGIDAIGAYFSDLAISTCSTYTCVLNYTPQIANPQGNILIDTLNWMQVSGCFYAQGGEKYLIIGNFTPYNQIQKNLNITSGTSWSSYYYIDDVSLYEDTILGVIKNNLIGDITLSPNPASTEFTLKSNEESMPNKFEITDILGNRIKEGGISKSLERVDVSQLSNGIYFVNLKFPDGQIKSKKLIISHK